MNFISTDGSKCDLVVVSKDMIKHASLSAEAFDELVFTYRKENLSASAAYYKAEELHQKIFGKPKYSKHASYKASYSERQHKRR